jgi:hypothetical protein
MRAIFMSSWRIMLVICSGAAIASCGGGGSGQQGGSGSSGGGQAGATGGATGGSTGGSGGSGGTAGSPGTGGQAGTGGVIAGGGSGGGGQGGSGAAGAAGGKGGVQGGAGAGGASGAAGAATGGAGGGGTAGAAGNVAAAGLADGTALLDITVTVGDKSTHITSCGTNDPHAAVMTHYPNGNSVGEIHCVPTPNGTLQVASFTISPLATGVGQHDASELVFNCSITAPIGCLGVADLNVVLNDGTSVEAYTSTTRSGTMTIDQFTSDGHVSGSMDLSLSKSGGSTFMIKGNFAADLHDCGAFGGMNFDPCTGMAG